jgi:hypothetical protein
MTIYQDYKVTYRDGSTNVFTGDSLASAALQAIAHGNPVCFEPICVERAFLLDGPHPYTGHDAVGYGMALSTWVAPQHIITWVHPHGTMQISDERMTGLYARDLADRLTDQAVRA